MFKPRGKFQSISCPYDGDCVLPRCLFAHSYGSVQGIKQTKFSPVSRDAIFETASRGDDRAAKRRRLDTAIDRKSEDIAPFEESEVPQVKSQPQVKVRTAATPALISEKRSVSPPPVRRSTAGLPVRIPTMASDKNDIAAKDDVLKPATKPLPTVKPPKTETLNPRMLSVSKTQFHVRLKLVQLLHEQLARLNTELANDASDSELPLVLSKQALITMSLDIEEKAGIEKPAVHASVVKNAILKYKKMSISDWKKEREAQVAIEQAKAEAAAGIKKPNTPKPIETGLPRELEIAILPKLFTPLTNLSGHGYVTTIPSDDSISTAKAGLSAAQGWEVCDRCKTRFQVFPGRRESDGLLCSGGTCKYHWGKAFFPPKQVGDVKGTKREKRYRCCGEAMGDSTGCVTAETHVFKVSEVKRLASLLNFIETPANDEIDSDNPINIDCEMGYTVHGLELIRLTATSWPSGSPLLDILVRPFGEVLDPNSRFSGVTATELVDAPRISADEKDHGKLAGTQKLHIVDSPAVARDLLLRFLAPETPVIGHGLENDLNSVRLIHHTVIDTALLFPHGQGLPYRNALRSLVSIHLGRTIQSGGKLAGAADAASGHDSKEDANAAGDLVHWAVGREWQRMQAKGWKLENGRLVPPANERSETGDVQIGLTDEVAGTKRKISEAASDGIEV